MNIPIRLAAAIGGTCELGVLDRRSVRQGCRRERTSWVKVLRIFPIKKETDRCGFSTFYVLMA